MYDGVGTLLPSSQGVANAHVLSLSGFAAGTYYARVVGYNGATNPGYTLTINAPTQPSSIPEDWAEQNDTDYTAAYDLGQVALLNTYTGLTMDDSANEATKVDWFKFETVSAGITDNALRIDSHTPRATWTWSCTTMSVCSSRAATA